jgi:hypothetical protein
MVEYRLRTPFRIAAWLPGLLSLASVVALVAKGLGSSDSERWFMIAFGLFLCAPAYFFLRIGWTGRVPASVEEYGLDGPGEIESSRAEARRLGRLYE